MITPNIPTNELYRINELNSFEILDTLPERDYDNITQLASNICNTNIALISLVDAKRQWFKSKTGLAASETPREHAFCAHAINSPNEILIVEDTHKDIRFHDNPLVTGAPFLKFYAGAPLVSKNGQTLGTLCVLHNKPHQLSRQQLDALKALSHQVISLLEQHRRNHLLNDKVQLLKTQNLTLQEFAHHAAHDLKSPLYTIQDFINIILTDSNKKIDARTLDFMLKIKNSSSKLSSMIDGLLSHSKLESIENSSREFINTKELLTQIKLLFVANEDTQIYLNTKIKELFLNRTIIEKILINLISNSIKYSDKRTSIISLRIIEDEKYYYFTLSDNGSGIPKHKLNSIFNLFEIATTKDRFGQRGNGIGLASVKKLVEKLSGTISVKSQLGQGSTFCFHLKKC